MPSVTKSAVAISRFECPSARSATTSRWRAVSDSSRDDRFGRAVPHRPRDAHGQFGAEDGATLRSVVNRLEQGARRRVFPHEPRRPSLERRADHVRIVERREHEHTASRARGANELETVPVGKIEVEDEDVDAGSGGRAGAELHQELGGVARLEGHVKIVFVADERGDACPEHRVIVADADPDHRRRLGFHGERGASSMDHAARRRRPRRPPA